MAKSSLSGIVGIAVLAGIGYAIYSVFGKGVGTEPSPTPGKIPIDPGWEPIPIPPVGEPPVFVPVPPGGYQEPEPNPFPPLPGPHEPWVPPGERQPYFHIGNKIGVGSGQNYHVITIMWIDTDNQIYGYVVQTAYGQTPMEMSWDAFEAQYKGLPVW